MEIILSIIGQYSLYTAILLTWLVFAINWKFGNQYKKLKDFNFIFNLSAATLLWISFLILIFAFIKKDYSYVTVYSYSDNSMSTSDRIMATWASRQGVMILWSAFLTSIAVGVMWYLKNDISHPMISRTLSILFFFSALIAAFTVSSKPGAFDVGLNYSNGLGLTPALLSIWQEIHPPVAFLAYASFVVPYATGLAMMSLKTDKIDTPHKLYWLNDLFMMLGWGLTGIFMVAGSIWGYEENSPGFWAWDPVEIATLVLWLVSTLYFHVKTQVPKNHPLQNTSAALGWVAVTFASFVVRGGFLEGYHSYAGVAKAIVFGLLFLGSAIGLIYALANSNETILPNKLFKWKSNSNKANLAAFWFLIFGITINIVGLIIQMINALIIHKTNIPYDYYIIFNGFVFFVLTILFVIYEINRVKMSSISKLILIDISGLLVFFILYFILSYTIILYTIASIIGTSFVILVGITFLNATKERNVRKFGKQIIHLTIILMIFSYFTVDMSTIVVNEVLVPEKEKNIEEFGIVINGTRMAGSSYPEVWISVCSENSHLGLIKIKQGYHLGKYWARGDWIVQEGKDLYFELQPMDGAVLVKDAPIPIIIYLKPLTNTFRVLFYLLLFVTTIGLYSTFKRRPINKNEVL